MTHLVWAIDAVNEPKLQNLESERTVRPMYIATLPKSHLLVTFFNEFRGPIKFRMEVKVNVFMVCFAFFENFWIQTEVSQYVYAQITDRNTV